MAMISLKEVIQDSFSRLAEKSCLLSLIKKLQHRTQIRQGYDPNISLFLVCPYLRQYTAIQYGNFFTVLAFAKVLSTDIPLHFPG